MFRWSLLLTVSLALLGACKSARFWEKKEAAPKVAKPPPPPPPSFDELYAPYKAGRVAEALKAMRAASKVSPAAKALVALTENRLSAVLAGKLPKDADALRYRARAAWRAGDGDALIWAVQKLALAKASDVELDAMAALAKQARGHWLRQGRGEVAAPTAFDARGRVPIVDVDIGGEKLRFVLDTGAEISLLDERLAAKLKVVRPPAPAPTGAGSVEAPPEAPALALVDRLVALGATIESVPVLMVPSSALPPGARVSGVLAAQDLFGEAVLTIDYGAGQIVRSRDTSADGWPLVLVDGRAILAIEGALDGGETGLFRVETGQKRSVLSAEYVDGAIAKGAPWNVLTPRKGGRSLVAALFCPSALLGCLEIKDAAIDAAPSDVTRVAYIGRLGGDAFAGKRIVFDYAAGRLRASGLVVAPPPPPPPPPAAAPASATPEAAGAPAPATPAAPAP